MVSPRRIASVTSARIASVPSGLLTCLPSPSAASTVSFLSPVRSFTRALVLVVCALGLGRAAAAPAAESAARRTILVLGDSLSAAHGIRVEQGWVALLQAR